MSAAKRPGRTSENLLQILEMRLDNLVYRLGFADSRAQARQLVCHGHFTVNGRKTDIPSFIAKPNDVISVRERSKGLEYFKTRALLLAQKGVPAWLRLDTMKCQAASLRCLHEQTLNCPLTSRWWLNTTSVNSLSRRMGRYRSRSFPGVCHGTGLLDYQEFSFLLAHSQQGI